MDPSRMEQACLDRAKDSALHALSDLGWPVADRLREYYDPDGDFAGASFTQLGPVVPDDITAADLYAVRLLNVRVGPRATRQLLDDGSTRRRILTALRALPTTDLADAGPDTWAAMGELYEAVKAGPSAKHARTPNPWVTASKLCARKRPDLFPVRDRVVCDYLELTHPLSARRDWQVFQYLITPIGRSVTRSMPPPTRHAVNYTAPRSPWTSAAFASSTSLCGPTRGN